MRWHHPARGQVPPLTFIPLAELSGQIVPIGRWVLGQACRQAASWRSPSGTEPLNVSVNLSMRQLAEPNLVGDVREALGESGLDSGLLTLEITESVLMQDADDVLPRLYALKDLGVRLAIDDFGTGYSSLAYLRHLPVDVVKIDKSFVDSLAERSAGEAFVHAIVDLSHSLELTTVAEGVEDQLVVSKLVAIGCDLAQGFHFARPMTATDVTELLQRSWSETVKAAVGSP